MEIRDDEETRLGSGVADVGTNGYRAGSQAGRKYRNQQGDRRVGDEDGTVGGACGGGNAGGEIFVCADGRGNSRAYGRSQNR
jgi:hypothetical protein